LTQRLIALSLVLAILLLSSPTTSNGEVGKVTEQTGPTEITRSKNSVPSSISSEVEMNDVVTTANSKTGITFKDDTKVQITEQSKLVIDTFVYDGEKKTGKLGIKMALGTIKYASGQIAKSDPQQVMVETPTATIGVRGTDFSGTVDETGKSTIVLLPSCPVGWRDIERDCVTGNISVSTVLGGTIWLTRPFEAVTIASSVTTPKSSILNLSLDQINNMMIVTPPKVVQQETSRKAEKGFNFLDENLLDKDLLKYDALDKNALDKPTGLDRNFLGTDYLLNNLDVMASQILTNELDQYGSLLPKYDKTTGLKYFVEGDQVTLYRETNNHYFDLKMETTKMGTVYMSQDNITIKQYVNGPGSTTITIKQSN
jgi:hypothetical protein